MKLTKLILWLFLTVLCTLSSNIEIQADEIIGKVIKVRKKKLTAKFPRGHKIKKRDMLKVYKSKRGKPGKYLGTFKVKKVKKRKVYGKFKKSGKVSKKVLKKALVVKSIQAESSSYSFFKPVVPRALLFGGFNYSMTGYTITTTAGTTDQEAELIYSENGDSTNEEESNVSLPENNQNAASLLPTSDSTTKRDGSAMPFGVDIAIYPLGFMEDSVAYNALGAGISYYMGTNTTKTSSTDSEESVEGKTDINFLLLDIRLRYAQFFSPTLYSSTIVKFFPIDSFKSTDQENKDNTGEFKYMSFGFEQRLMMQNFLFSAFLKFPISKELLFNGESFKELVTEILSTLPGDEDGTYSLKGFNAGGQLGYQYQYFVFLAHVEYFSRSFGWKAGDISWNTDITYTTFGAKLGISY